MGTLTDKHPVNDRWRRATEVRSLPEFSLRDSHLAAILALPDLERFVYVLSVLEGCTDQECADLLNVSLEQIEETRLNALRHFWKR
jgi:DNA-directed RNA polymerase specialized sigma24 family protein